jgi:hypothetical protein
MLVIRLRRLYLRSGLQTVAAVRVRPGFQGSEIQVTLRSDLFTSAFMTFWIGFTIIFNLVFLGSALNGGAHFADLAFTGLFPIWGFAFIAIARLIGHSDGRRLLDFIRETTGAQDPPPGFAPGPKAIW